MQSLFSAKSESSESDSEASADEAQQPRIIEDTKMAEDDDENPF